MSFAHQVAYDIADYIGFAVLAMGFGLVLTSGAGSRYKSINEMPRKMLIRTALIWFPLVLLVAVTQSYHHSWPWLMYVPFPWVYPARAVVD